MVRTVQVVAGFTFVSNTLGRLRSFGRLRRFGRRCVRREGRDRETVGILSLTGPVQILLISLRLRCEEKPSLADLLCKGACPSANVVR